MSSCVYGIGAKLYAAVLSEVDGSYRRELPQEDSARRAAVNMELLHPEHRIFHHLVDHSVWGFLEMKLVLCASYQLFLHIYFLFNFSNMFIGSGSI